MLAVGIGPTAPVLIARGVPDAVLPTDGSPCIATGTGAVVCWDADVHELAYARALTKGPCAPEDPHTSVPMDSCFMRSGISSGFRPPQTVLEPTGRRIKALSGGIAGGCAVLDDGEPHPWGAGACPSLGAGHGHIVQMAQGVSHLCVLTDAGEVWCSGRGDYGMLGDGRGQDSEGFVRARGVRDATALVAGLRYTCAIADAGDVYCWGGREDDGEGTKPRRLVPVKVAGIRGAKAIAGSQLHVCALLAGGDVYCWGSLPEGVSVKPQLRPEFHGAVSLNNECALLPDGSVTCWSSGQHGAVPIEFGGTVEAIDEPRAAECVAHGCSTLMH